MREAQERLAALDGAEELDETTVEPVEETVERPLRLHQQRLAAVLAILRAEQCGSVLDLGCGEGRLLREMLQEPQFSRITGVDAVAQCLDTAAERLRWERMPPRQRQRISLLHGSSAYRDRRRPVMTQWWRWR